MLKSKNPAARAAVYDDAEVRWVFPMADLIRESIADAAPRPKTPYYTDVSAAVARTFHPPAAVRPTRTPAAADRLVVGVLHDRVLLWTAPAGFRPPDRRSLPHGRRDGAERRNGVAGAASGPGGAAARLDARRPGPDGDGRRDRLSAGPGGVAVALQLPAHRPGRTGVRRPAQLRRRPRRPPVVERRADHRRSSPSSPWPSSWSSASPSPRSCTGSCSGGGWCARRSSCPTGSSPSWRRSPGATPSPSTPASSTTCSGSATSTGSGSGARRWS